MSAFLPLLPLIGLVLATGLLLLDRWLQRPGFAVESLTLGSIGILTLFGLAGAATGNPVNAEGAQLSPLLTWIGRAGTALLYGSILFGVLRLPDEGPGRLMWAGAATWSVLATFAELVNPGPIDVQLLFLPLGAFMLWRSRGTDVDHVVRVLKAGLWFLVLASAVVALTPAGWVGTGGSFIGLDVRLTGVTAHPNSLGPYLVYLLLINVISPPTRLVALAWVLPLVMLLATQSKTAWAGAVVGAGVLWWFRVGIGLLQRNRWLPALLAILVVAGAGLLVAVESPSQEFLSAEDAESLTTLTGRSNIWGAGLDAFQANPVFGAGSDFYRRYAESSGQSWAGQAHNEFIQTIASDGLVGVTGLLVYLFVLLFLGVRLAPVSAGGSLAFVAAFVLRWMTETPARGLSFEHILILALMMAWSREAPVMARLERVGVRELWRGMSTPQVAAEAVPDAARDHRPGVTGVPGRSEPRQGAAPGA